MRKTLIITIGLIILNVLVRTLDIQWDFTTDKRYTLSQEAKELLRSSDEPLIFTVLLEGNIPASFRPYRDYIDYYLSEIARYDKNVDVIYKNPNEGDDADQFRAFLRNQGVDGTSRQVGSRDEVSKSLIYPYISIHNEKGIEFVDLLTAMKPNESESEALLRSQLKLESKLLRKLKSLENKRSSKIHVLGPESRLLTEGFNRDERTNSREFVASNGEYVFENLDSIDAIICVTNNNLSRRDLLSVDIASQRGIPIFWFVDKFDVTLDSLTTEGRFYAIHNEVNIEDYLFKLGLRIEPSLVLDLNCSAIPQVTGVEGGRSKTVLLPYPYHLLIQGDQEGLSYTKTSNPVHLQYVSPVSVTRENENIEYIPLLTSSKYSSIKKSPIALDFELMRVQPNPDEYNEGKQIVGLELKGDIPRYFTARLSDEERQFITPLLSNINDKKVSRQFVFGDASFISPTKGRDGGLYPVGYNNWDRKMYEGNLEFFNNILESSIDGNQLMKLADRDVAVGLLDIPLWKKNKATYSFLLLGFPILLLILTYFLNGFLRKRRYENYKV